MSFDKESPEMLLLLQTFLEADFIGQSILNFQKNQILCHLNPIVVSMERSGIKRIAGLHSPKCF